jgi:citrate lyase subunit beta/citryl-CoA lyase
MHHAIELPSRERVELIAFGSIDFQSGLSIRAHDQKLQYFCSQLVLLSRVAGLHFPVDGVNACFGISAQELVRARRVTSAGDAANGAAIAMDGQIVDKPVLVRAHAMLTEAIGLALAGVTPHGQDTGPDSISIPCVTGGTHTGQPGDMP